MVITGNSSRIIQKQCQVSLQEHMDNVHISILKRSSSPLQSTVLSETALVGISLKLKHIRANVNEVDAGIASAVN